MPNRWLAPYPSLSAGKAVLRRSIARRWTKASLLALALAGALGAGMPTEAAVPTDWKNTPYAYDAQNTPLPKVLGDFANTVGV
ncbi:MAG: EscC/YscC/HrcC family type III secretion system outer membrane ring protein, partial [Pseudomonas sp.]